MDNIVEKLKDVYKDLYPTIKEVRCFVKKMPDSRYSIAVYVNNNQEHCNMFRSKMLGPEFQEHFKDTNIFTYPYHVSFATMLVIGASSMGVFCLDGEVTVKQVHDIMAPLITQFFIG